MDIMLVLIVVLIIVLAWRGPAMLPKLGQALGRGVKEAKDEIGGALKDDPAAPGTPGMPGAASTPSPPGTSSAPTDQPRT